MELTALELPPASHGMPTPLDTDDWRVLQNKPEGMVFIPVAASGDACDGP
ncbi:hypothetical protein [Nocardia lijiangensis]